MSPMFSIGEKGNRAGQDVFQRHTAAPEVGQIEDREPDKDGHSEAMTPIGMDVG